MKKLRKYLKRKFNDYLKNQDNQNSILPKREERQLKYKSNRLDKHKG